MYIPSHSVNGMLRITAVDTELHKFPQGFGFGRRKWWLERIINAREYVNRQKGKTKERKGKRESVFITESDRQTGRDRGRAWESGGERQTDKVCKKGRKKNFNNME